MKRNLILFALVLVASTANAQWVDDLYAGTSKRTQTAHSSTYQTVAASADITSGRVDNYGVSAAELDRVSNEELITSYEDALARRLSAMRTSEVMDQAYWDIMQQYQMILEQRYDQNLYNIVVVGNEMWVEPIYITSLFTGDDATAGVAAYADNVVNELFGSGVNYTMDTSYDNSNGDTNINIYIDYDPWNWGYSYWGWGGYYWGSSFYNPWGFYSYAPWFGYYGGFYGSYWPGYYRGFYRGFYGAHWAGYWPSYRPGFMPGHGHGGHNNVYLGNNRGGVTRSGGTGGLGGSRGMTASTRATGSTVARPNGANTVNGMASSRRNSTNAAPEGVNSSRRLTSVGGVADNFKSGTGVGSTQLSRRNENSSNVVNNNRTQTNRASSELNTVERNNNLYNNSSRETTINRNQTNNNNSSIINRNTTTNNRTNFNSNTVNRSTTTGVSRATSSGRASSGRSR